MDSRLESDCASCLLRPRDVGGNGSCPFRSSLYPVYLKRSQEGEPADCPRFREGDYEPKPKGRSVQGEALF